MLDNVDRLDGERGIGPGEHPAGIRGHQWGEATPVVEPDAHDRVDALGRCRYRVGVQRHPGRQRYRLLGVPTAAQRLDLLIRQRQEAPHRAGVRRQPVEPGGELSPHRGGRVVEHRQW